jgi:hypothetical protein
MASNGNYSWVKKRANGSLQRGSSRSVARRGTPHGVREERRSDAARRHGGSGNVEQQSPRMRWGRGEGKTFFASSMGCYRGDKARATHVGVKRWATHVTVAAVVGVGRTRQDAATVGNPVATQHAHGAGRMRSLWLSGPCPVLN